MTLCNSDSHFALGQRHLAHSASTLLPQTSESSAHPASSGDHSTYTIQLPTFETWTNDSFARWLCGNLEESSVSPSSLTLIGTYSDTNHGNRFIVPDCLFAYVSEMSSNMILDSRLKRLYMSNVIIAGNEARPNPLARLDSALKLESISLTNVTLLNASGAAADIDWETTFSTLHAIKELEVKNSHFGPGTTIPPSIPDRIVHFDLSGSYTSEANGHAKFALLPMVKKAVDQSWRSDGPLLDFHERDTLATPSDTVSLLLYAGNSSNIISDAICNVNVRVVTLNVVSGSFTIPPCTAATYITSLSLTGIEFPVFDYFPKTMEYLWIQGCVGYLNPSVSIDLDNALLRFPNLDSFTLSQCGVISSMPTRVQVSKLNFFNNAMTGTIVPSFFVNSPNLTSFAINVNQITGAFPWYGLGKLVTLSASKNNFTRWPSLDFSLYPDPPTELNSIYFDNQPYLTEIPGPASWVYSTKLGTVDFHANPMLAGRQHPIVVPGVLKNIQNYDITGSGLTGALPELPANSDISTSIVRQFLFAGNRLTGTFPVSWSNYTFLNLDLTDNVGITGTLPQKLFGPARLEFLHDAIYTGSPLSSFVLDGTSLTGPMTFSTPDYNADFLSRPPILSAVNAFNIDFCSDSVSSMWNATTNNCNLRGTSAYYCQERYNKSNCAFSVPPPPSPISPPTSPCDFSKRPSEAFICIGTSWTLFGDYEETTLVIPSGGAQVVVVGDVSSTSIVVAGIGSTLTLQTGCVTNLANVTIELSPEELKQLGSTTTQLLVSSRSAANCSELGSVNLFSKVNGDSCKKVSAKSVVKNGQLSALLSIDSSGCRAWWIILVAVIASVVVLGVAIFVLLVIFVKPVRHWVRPYSKRNKAQNTEQLS